MVTSILSYGRFRVSRFGEGFGEDRHAVVDRVFGDDQRRRYLDGRGAEADRGEHEDALFHGSAHDFPGEVGVGFLGSWDDTGETGHQAPAIDTADLAVSGLQGAESLVQHCTDTTGVTREVLVEDEIDRGKGGGAAYRISRVARCHAQRRWEIHDVGSAGDGGERQRA
jgi:hypothetical protein